MNDKKINAISLLSGIESKKLNNFLKIMDCKRKACSLFLTKKQNGSFGKEL
jgi:hypothetical protein